MSMIGPQAERSIHGLSKAIGLAAASGCSAGEEWLLWASLAVRIDKEGFVLSIVSCVPMDVLIGSGTGFNRHTCTEYGVCLRATNKWRGSKSTSYSGFVLESILVSAVECVSWHLPPSRTCRPHAAARSTKRYCWCYCKQGTAGSSSVPHIHIHASSIPHPCSTEFLTSPSAVSPLAQQSPRAFPPALRSTHGKSVVAMKQTPLDVDSAYALLR
jgi:hypothetical protein